MPDLHHPARVERWAAEQRTVFRFPSSEHCYRGRLESLEAAVGFVVPTVIGDFGEWVVTTTPPGHRGDRPDLHPDPDDLIVAMAAGLRSLHDLPVTSLVTETDTGAAWDTGGWQSVIARCQAAVERGLVVSENLPEPYRRYSPDDLLAMLIGSDAGQGDDDPVASDVLCHGAATADRFLVDGGRFVGFDGFELALVADRHLDLAIVHQSIQQVFGPEAIFRFYEAYGQDPNIARLEQYVLAGHLMPSVTAGSSPR